MRSVLWYLLFVGIPLLALLVVLNIGEGLSAPRAVHGVYAIAFDSASAGPCLPELMSDHPREITVSQSGTRLDMQIGRVALIGAIVGDSLRGSSAKRKPQSLRSAGCLTVDSLALVAAALGASDSRQLAGQLVFHGCATCPPVSFQATRSAERSREKGV